MNRSLISLTAGVWTPVPATRFSRRVEIAEDGSATAVGIALKFPEDNFTQQYDYPVGQQPVVLGNAIAQGRGVGPILGWPAQSGANARAADNYCLASAMSATTKIRVTEID